MFDALNRNCRTLPSDYRMSLSLRIVATTLLLALGTACASGSDSSEPMTFGSWADSASRTTQTTVLDSIVTAYMSRHRIPGLTVGIVVDGKAVYSKGFGIADPVENRTVTDQTLFHLASVSKPVVATAVLQLVEQGRVELDEPVRSYLPYFELADDRAGSISVRQMLSHTSGMPDVRDYGWANPEFDDGALERYVRSLADRRLEHGPGERFSYSNMAYEVLGDLVAKVSGLSFEEYVKENILNPLKMENSTFLRSEIAESLGATPHVGRRASVSGVYPYHRAHAPSSTLHSSAAEMNIWIQVNVNRGLLGEVRILDESTYDLLWASHAEGRPGRHMGLGWMFADSPLGLWVLHGGRDIGFLSHVSLFPDVAGGIVLLSNWSDTPIQGLRNALVEASFGVAFN